MADVETWDVKELAEFLGLTSGYVRDMARLGVIPRDYVVRPVNGRKWRFLKAQMIEWAKAGPTEHQRRCEVIKRRSKK